MNAASQKEQHGNVKKIIFICTGNTCRSPMAQAFFNAAAGNDNKLHGLYTAASRGLHTYGGEPASMDASAVMKDIYGISLKSHISKRLTAEDVHGAFLLLTMTVNHKRALVSAFPVAAGRTFTLKEYTAGCDGENNRKDIGNDYYHNCLDISDPFGMPSEAFVKCAGEISFYIGKLIKSLIL
jgi:protein-tyrosine-phosphatase